MKTKITPSLYFPCRNCGLWRRQHLGDERKCPFSPGCFDPTVPEKLSHADRERLMERIERLQRQLVNVPRDQLDKLDVSIDGLTMEATKGCDHKNDNGESILERHAPTEGKRYHIICSLCHEDWYEDDD